MTNPIDEHVLRDLWQRALAEDGVDHDMTCQVAFPEKVGGVADINGRQAGVFAGRVLLEAMRSLYTGSLKVEIEIEDGRRLAAGTRIATLSGSLRLLLGIERTLLNFLERMCGVATTTRGFVDAVAGTEARILDTRKTLPGWRILDKYAVRCGGGHNHRMGLHDAILVKDNHLAGIPAAKLAEAAAQMVRRQQQLNLKPGFVEFEVDTLEQLDALLGISGIDVILVDNFTPAQLGEAVRRRDAAGLRNKLALEASGGIDLSTVAAFAATGVDRISVGAITHSAPALDLGMDIRVGR
jgi:nicotinate-nucleotide pyrophosphorylase (carboxylating)